MSLKLAQPGCQFIIVCDASFYAAGFILLIEDNLESEEPSKDKTYAPVSFGSHLFSPAQLKHSIYAKEFLGIYLAFESFEHYIWGVSTKPVIVLTDNKSVTRFFQTKKLPGNLWNAVDYVLSFNFVLGHTSGKANAAADYLSRIHVNPSAKLKLKLSDRIPVKDIEVEVLAQTPDNSLTALITAVNVPLITIDSEETCTTIHLSAFFEPKDQSLNKLSEENPLDKFELSKCLKSIDMFNEQSKDNDIQKALNWLRKKDSPISMYGSYDLQKYHKQLGRLILDGNILCRKFYDHSGKNFIKQIVIPKQLRTELIYRIHNSKLKGHLGIQKTIHEFRRKFFFPGYTEFLITYINNCLTCLQAKSPKHETLTMPLSPVSSNTSLPADMLQIDIVGQLPKSGGYSYILTGMDVFSKYMFAQPLPSISADRVCKFLMQWFMRHSYIPLVILTDQGSQFTSRMLEELSTLLEFKIEHATVKHAQTIGALERSHGPLKRYLRIYENQLPRDWHKYVDLAVFQHNTSYHSTLACPPTLIFHGRIPQNPLDLRFSNKNIYHQQCQYDYISDIQSKMATLFSQTKENLVNSFNKYREYYDRKAKAAPLKLHDYCMLLSPKLSKEHEKISNLECKWTALFRIEKVLTRSNYLIRRVNTNNTQIVHRVRLKPIKPQYKFQDLQNIDEKLFKADPMIAEALREPNLFDHALEELTFSYDKNRRAKVYSKIATEPESKSVTEMVQNTTAEEPPRTPEMENTGDTSPFYTPESEKLSSRSHTPQSSPKSDQNNDIVTEPPTTSSIPVSNLAKLLKEKRHERETAKQQAANTDPTLQTRIPQPQKPTSSSSLQVADTVSRYGRMRKQTQHFQSS